MTTTATRHTRLSLAYHLWSCCTARESWLVNPPQCRQVCYPCQHRLMPPRPAMVTPSTHGCSIPSRACSGPLPLRKSDLPWRNPRSSTYTEQRGEGVSTATLVTLTAVQGWRFSESVDDAFRDIGQKMQHSERAAELTSGISASPSCGPLSDHSG